MGSFDYSIKYQLVSDLKDDSSSKLINNYEAEVVVNKPSGGEVKIGRFRFSVVLVRQISETGSNLLQVLEQQEELIHICEQFIELTTGRFKEEFKYNASDICIIRELELLPGFRGKALGASIVNDFRIRFKSMFSILCVEAIPFQVATIKRKRILGDNLDDFSKAMRYEDGMFDEETVKLKLFAFFQKLGFTLLKNDLFYLCTTVKQEEVKVEKLKA